jgi:ribonuclease P protein component
LNFLVKLTTTQSGQCGSAETLKMSKLPSLKKNYEFHKVYGKGKYASSRALVVYVLKNRKDANRIGITTSKKVGNSVVRNRYRRLVRENLRLIMPSLPKGFDIVIVVRKMEKDPGLAGIGFDLKDLFVRLGLLSKG